LVPLAANLKPFIPVYEVGVPNKVMKHVQIAQKPKSECVVFWCDVERHFHRLASKITRRSALSAGDFCKSRSILILWR